jgi:hypothetical protein
MRKLYFIILFAGLFIVVDAQPPVINSLTPSIAPAGAQITIKGNRFSPLADNNKVYFGTVKATVSNSTDTTITVTVPAGSAYMPVTVTIDTFTAFSRQPFITSYSNNLQLRINSIGEPRVIAGARYPCYGDFDNDGRVDIAAINNNNQVSLYKNTDSTGYASFKLSATYAAATGPIQMISADFNADGKLDIALATSGSASVSLYKNTSTTGNISFANQVYYLLSGDNYPYTLSANDIDGDGKTDLIISYAHQGTCFSVARNTSSGGNISFANRVNFAFGTVPGGSGNVGDANKIYVADIDGDGKPDVTSLSRFFPPFLIYRNTSTPGIVSFAAKVSITSYRDNTVGNGFFDMKLADIDGDNKPEIIYTSSDSSLLSVYKNLSTPGNISFTGKINFIGPFSPVYVATNDINGDGKVDVAVTGRDSIYIYTNNSLAGNVSFQTHRSYKGYSPSEDITTSDLDADGKADIIISGIDVNNNNKSKIHLLKNVIDEEAPLALCPVTDSITLEPGVIGNSYQWQIDTGNGYINVEEDANHSGATSPLLVLRNPPSSWYGYKYRCVVDGINSAAQSLKFTATWLGSFNNLWENPLNWKCGQLPDENSDVIVNYNFLILNSNRQVRSITVKPGAFFQISFGMRLTVTH